MLLRRMQAELAAVYATPLGYDVYDYLITDRTLAATLTPESAPSQNLERVLVGSSTDDVLLSLYIDETVLNHLGLDDPTQSLHAGNLAEFLIAFEGVSHLHYLMWNATHDTAVSLFEIELQAEVDKYVACARILGRHTANAIPAKLHEVLFEHVSFDTALSTEARTRYHEANYFAAKYCADLRRRFPAHHWQPSFLRELRAFYRLSQNQKISRIRALN